jgi:purine-binding chemotaxis protein CheW
MSQASQAKAMQEYFDALLNEVSPAPAPLAEDTAELATELATTLLQTETIVLPSVETVLSEPADRVPPAYHTVDHAVGHAIEPERRSEAVPVLPRFIEPELERAKPLAQLLSSVEILAEPEVAVSVEPVLAAPQIVVAEPEITVATTTETDLSMDEGIPPQTPSAPWRNLDPGEEFPALFFMVGGVTFAVPLTDLGGIHKIDKVTPLFGKPEWFAGVMMHRDTQLNVVDSNRWFLPGENPDLGSDYEYLVLLGETRWGIACHALLGTETLITGQVKWRDKPGKRPWLAGMVKDRMCALLHVQELLTLFQQGVNIDGQ